MKSKLLKIQAICTIFIIVDILLWAGYKWAGLELSDTVIRMMGIGNLIAIPLLVYSKVKLSKQ